MATRSPEERLAELDEKMNQIKAQKRALKNRVSAEERKKRTHRLIEIGGAVESVLGRPIEKEDIPLLVNFLNQQEKNGSFFTKAMSKGSVPPEQ